LAVLVVAPLALAGLAGSAATASTAGAAARHLTRAVVSQATDGVLTGNVVIRNAPAYFEGEVGVAACPATSTPPTLCASPLLAEAESGASYTLDLPAGAWDVYELYSIGFEGGAYIGRAHSVTIVGGATSRLNISVKYQIPTAMGGTVTVTGVPTGVTIEELVVTACPSSQPLVNDNPSSLCDSDYLLGSDTYSLPTLFKGHWSLYVGYETLFGYTQVTTPTAVSLPKGGSVSLNLSAAYQTPTDGAVEGTVTITGAPPGFSPVFEGAGGCPVTNGSGMLCSDPIYTLIESGDTYQLPLTPGEWGVAGFYELAGFGGQFLSPHQLVDVSAGVIDQLNFTIPYSAPAKVEATVTVTGLPSGVTVEETLLLACPTDASYMGGSATPIECVEGEGVGNVDTIDTLPPGTWLLYPGYFTSNGTYDLGTQATTVKLKAGKTKKVSLSIGYQAP
jgi:hypothetical protein